VLPIKARHMYVYIEQLKMYLLMFIYRKHPR